jgi:ribosomal-protein-alanine N-acetyltransferase
MTKLERLRADHATALLAFERENREFFALSIPDRGDAYFSEFEARHRALLAEQDTGACHFHVVVDERGDLLGRVNLVDVQDGNAELGYRIGEHATGRGVATAAYGLRSLVARTTTDNPASQRVLSRNGFTVVGDITINGRPGVRYHRRLPEPAP